MMRSMVPLRTRRIVSVSGVGIECCRICLVGRLEVLLFDLPAERSLRYEQ